MSKLLSSFKAFTLVELLVVVSIMIVLISLLLPALSNVREQGKNLSCKSSMRQLALGEFLYAADYKDTLTSDWVQDSTIWQIKLDPYAGGKGLKYPSPSFYNNPVFWCPSAFKSPSAGQRHHGMNEMIWHDMGTWSAPKNWRGRASAPPCPSQVVLLSEMNANNEVSGGNKILPTPDGTTPTLNRMSHLSNTSGNYAFCDAHVESIKGCIAYTVNSQNAKYWKWW